MRTPSPSYCRLDLAPPLADQFIFGVAPIDYGPVLLLKPFGFHLAMDTLPSRELQMMAPGPPWLVSGFRFRARLGFSIPFPFPGPRGITPAFGYGAPHPSAGGTLTLLSNALLSALYDPLRLPSRPSPYRGCCRCDLHHTRISRNYPDHLSGMPRSVPRRIEQVRLSISSLFVLPSPVNWRVGIRNFTFEACSSFTHVAAYQIAARLKADICPEAPTQSVTRPSRSEERRVG